MTVLTLLRGQFSRVLRKKAVRHEAGVEADVGVGVEEAVVVGAVVAVEVVAEVAVARKASPLQCLRNKAEKSANGLLSLTVALILVFVVRLSPLLRHQKKQKQMLHDICTAIKLCVSCVQFVLWGIAFCLERRRLLLLSCILIFSILLHAQCYRKDNDTDESGHKSLILTTAGISAKNPIGCDMHAYD